MEAREGRALEILALTPFLDRGEISAIAGWSDGDSREVVSFLMGRGLVHVVGHSTGLISSTQRFYLSEAGLRALAWIDGSSVDHVLRCYPVSREWRDVLLGRLDGLSVVYRLVKAVCRVTGVDRVKLYRNHPLDATLELDNGSTLGVLRQGVTASRRGLRARLDRLFDGQFPGGILAIASDPVRLRQIANLERVRNTAWPIYLTLEEEAARAGPETPVWRPSEHFFPLTLAEAVSGVLRRGIVPDEDDVVRASPPDELLPMALDGQVPVRRMPIELKPREKEVLDTLAAWPWLSSADLCGIMDIRTRSRLSQLIKWPEALGLIRPLRAGGLRRLNLTDRGFSVLALRDRSSRSELLKLWSVEFKEPGAGLSWRNVSGSNSAVLLRQLTHTQAVHGIVASLVRAARSQGIAVVQLDPPDVASRYFQDDWRDRSIVPDAFGMLGRDDRRCAFFLEYERRSIHPSTMPSKINPYLAYYSTNGPEDDQQVIPVILFVFESHHLAERFLNVARRMLHGTDTDLPLWASSDEALHRDGPLGPVWMSPFADEPDSPLRRLLSL